MNKEDIITLDDNKEYLILDIIDYLNKKYLYCVLVDEDDIPTQEYKYVEVINENNETYIEEVNDEKILENLVNLVTINYLNDSTNEEQAA